MKTINIFIFQINKLRLTGFISLGKNRHPSGQIEDLNRSVDYALEPLL